MNIDKRCVDLRGGGNYPSTWEGSGTFFGSIMANLPNELAAEKGT